MAVIQRVEGVVGVDIDCLYIVGEKCKRNDVIPPTRNRTVEIFLKFGFSSLNPAPEGVILKEMGI